MTPRDKKNLQALYEILVDGAIAPAIRELAAIIMPDGQVGEFRVWRDVERESWAVSSAEGYVYGHCRELDAAYRWARALRNAGISPEDDLEAITSASRMVVQNER